jgi:UDP-N-acetylglucosamine/UDP-N-acetylgalactosamine 4-epimerase
MTNLICPDGAYAAVIPKWIAAMLANDDVHTNGDGETSRDFCFVGNVVQANLRAALSKDLTASEVYNVAVGGRTTLNDLFHVIRDGLTGLGVTYEKVPAYRDFRAGDVRNSQADVSKARTQLSYAPLFDLRAGMAEALPWYLNFLRSEAQSAAG